MSEFETVHRELRQASGGFPYADEAAAAAAEEAEDRLRDFYGRTGSAVDDVVEAARLAAFCIGRVEFQEPSCFEARLPRERSCNGCWLKRQIAALDEAARYDA